MKRAISLATVMQLTLIGSALSLIADPQAGKSATPPASGGSAKKSGKSTTKAEEPYIEINPVTDVKLVARAHSFGAGPNGIEADGLKLSIAGDDGKEIEIPLLSTTVEQGRIQTTDFGVIKMSDVTTSNLGVSYLATKSQIAKLRAFKSAHQ